VGDAFWTDGEGEVSLAYAADMLATWDVQVGRSAAADPGSFRMEDGRELINMLTAEGKRIYKARRLVAWEAQGGLCAICGRTIH
jgi:hypothetical protein